MTVMCCAWRVEQCVGWTNKQHTTHTAEQKTHVHLMYNTRLSVGILWTHTKGFLVVLVCRSLPPLTSHIRGGNNTRFSFKNNPTSCMFAIPVNCEVAHAGIFGGTRKLRSQRFFALTKLEIDYFKLNLSLNRWNNTPRNMYNNNHTKREARVSYI